MSFFELSNLQLPARLATHLRWLPGEGSCVPYAQCDNSKAKSQGSLWGCYEAGSDTGQGGQCQESQLPLPSSAMQLRTPQPASSNLFCPDLHIIVAIPAYHHCMMNQTRMGTLDTLHTASADHSQPLTQDCLCPFGTTNLPSVNSDSHVTCSRQEGQWRLNYRPGQWWPACQTDTSQVSQPHPSSFEHQESQRNTGQLKHLPSLLEAQPMASRKRHWISDSLQRYSLSLLKCPWITRENITQWKN